MSRSAGTLHTTYNANYIPPRFMPGYNGHVPTMKFDYGETYATATAKNFHDYRSHTLNTSHSPYKQGGYFPTTYSHNPDLVIGNRTRGRDRWLSAPRYRLSNVDHDRKEELIKFDQLSSSHREHYKDRSGEVHKVEYFQLPTRAEDIFKKHLPFIVLSERYTDDIQIPERDHIARRKPINLFNDKKTTQKERAIRDVYFEMR